ncbi:hypothetical protein BZM27_10885 [Paraburkholderia steynii]|uniref:Uncharacterized protein n=1 Tax=Paraburkholderia steynii TaxID=1245441 RepID=A0A4R0XIK6_9BURK|nr:hypothetical protein BZM27_10885 [Paraburkholderia steynii]
MRAASSPARRTQRDRHVPRHPRARPPGLHRASLFAPLQPFRRQRNARNPVSTLQAVDSLHTQRLA